MKLVSEKPGLRNNILYYNILQYIVTNTIYCSSKSIAIYCIVVQKYCNILYCCFEVLQYIVLLFWSIAIYCIVVLNYCNILYCHIEVLQYIVEYIVRWQGTSTTYYSSMKCTWIRSYNWCFGQGCATIFTIYCNLLSPIQYIVALKVLQYIALSFWSIAIYCIALLKYCNILYWRSKVLQYIVLLN